MTLRPPVRDDPPPFRTVAAVITDDQGRVLLVRKRGTSTFIQPGGKREPGETALQTLARELHEELGVRLRAETARLLGTFEDRAVNEPGRRVQAEVYQVRVDGEPTAAAEIEALHWLDHQPPYAVPVAPLSADHVLPAHRACHDT
jgi:8-oxo-dGTP diphosphatase